MALRPASSALYSPRSSRKPLTMGVPAMPRFEAVGRFVPGGGVGGGTGAEAANPPTSPSRPISRSRSAAERSICSLKEVAVDRRPPRPELSLLLMTFATFETQNPFRSAAAEHPSETKLLPVCCAQDVVILRSAAMKNLLLRQAEK